jgi:RNA polymerase sigma-70 factor (ECF subfamily)
MQESHYTAYTQLGNFRKESSYKTWLTRIHLHKCHRKVNYGAVKFEQTDTDMSEAINEQVKINREETGRVIVNRELARLLEISLKNLPLPYRSVFLLRELEGFSIAETADLLEITPINVKVRLNRAKTMLRQQLEKFYTASELFEFNEIYCNAIVHNVFEKIHQQTP